MGTRMILGTLLPLLPFPCLIIGGKGLWDLLHVISGVVPGITCVNILQVPFHFVPLFVSYLTGTHFRFGFHFQTDMYGRCPASVEAVQEQNGSWTISKSKDINRCLHRQGFDFAMNTGSYQSDGVSSSKFCIRRFLFFLFLNQQ